MGVASQAREVQRGIAGRVFGTLGTLGAVLPTVQAVRVVHDRVTESVYSGARTLTGAVVHRGAHAFSLKRPEDARSIQASVS